MEIPLFAGVFFYQSLDEVKKNPDSEVGGPNQKPLTIKPYPMKIHG
jgi:hypothetical protein